MQDSRAARSSRAIRTSGVPNLLLATLTEEDRDLITAESESVRLRLRDVLHEPGSGAEYVYLPSSGVVSLLTVLEDGSAVEIATVGNEGLIDVAAYLGLESPARWLVQVPGEALRIKASSLRALAQRSGALLSVIHNYMLAMFVLVSQTAACNRKHSIGERCARWLLMTHDRVDGEQFPITHEFLADMLGVRRPSVSIAMRALSRAGLIDYRRGKLTVKDRAGLEKAACRCYEIIRHAVDQRFPVSPQPHSGPAN